MGKKVKPNSLLDNALNGQEVVNVQDQEVKEQDQEAFVDKSLVGNGPMTAEAREKLEKYDALEKSVVDLAKEKEVLEAKIAEYAERLAELQTASSKINSLEKENDKLKKKLESAKDTSSEVAKLKLEAKALRDEADGYLVKISELTFENANLTCQLDELSKKMASHGNVPNQKQFAPNVTPPVQGRLRRPNTNAYNPYMNNGYGAWN